MKVEQIDPNSESLDLPFTIEEVSESQVNYIFEHAKIVVDTNSLNHQTKYPEISFATFNTEENKFTYDQSDNVDIDMNYIAACIKKVSKVTGIKEFWFFPSGADNEADTERRSKARARLFSRYVDLTPDEDGFGYIIKV